jgi:hypothetical protein
MHPMAERIAAVLSAENGYVETGENHTKFSDDLDAAEAKLGSRIPRQGSRWCGTFIDWGFWKTDALSALVFRNFTTAIAAREYKRVGRWTFVDPEPGELAFKTLDGPGHIGFVLEVKRGAGGSIAEVVTIEGNTSGGSHGSQTNGGQVAIRKRSMSDWAGFGRPKYELFDGGDHFSASAATTDLFGIAALVAQWRNMTLARKSHGPAVGFWQRLVGVDDDEDFGKDTEEATSAFQKVFRADQQSRGLVEPFLLEITGIVDAHTWAARLDVP